MLGCWFVEEDQRLRLWLSKLGWHHSADVLKDVAMFCHLSEQVVGGGTLKPQHLAPPLLDICRHVQAVRQSPVYCTHNLQPRRKKTNRR